MLYAFNKACHSTFVLVDFATLPCQSEVFKFLLPLASEWQNIGVLLEIADGELKRIKADNHHQSTNCLREMIGFWLKRDDPPPNWKELCEAVKPFDPSKAKEMEEKCIHIH